VKVLLDTHIFLWWNAEPKKIPAAMFAILEDRENDLILSVISAWEIAIKYAKGKLPLPDSPAVYVPARAAHYGIQMLPLELTHVFAAESLPPLHANPFDRALIGQSRVERIPLLTVDPQVLAYGGFDI
jgi:PIN domain nuclease of toxin-antitoxin system